MSRKIQNLFFQYYLFKINILINIILIIINIQKNIN